MIRELDILKGAEYEDLQGLFGGRRRFVVYLVFCVRLLSFACAQKRELSRDANEPQGLDDDDGLTRHLSAFRLNSLRVEEGLGGAKKSQRDRAFRSLCYVPESLARREKKGVERLLFVFFFSVVVLSFPDLRS